MPSGEKKGVGNERAGEDFGDIQACEVVGNCLLVEFLLWRSSAVGTT
jgi:hypothetical protein